MRPSQVDVAVVGSVNIDLVASVTRLPLPGETIHAVGYTQFVGGKGGNQAVAAARLGRRVAFVGLTGDDAEGQAVRAALRAQGVDLGHLGVDTDSATGRAIVLVDAEAENSIVVVGGANSALTPAHLAPAADLLARATVVVAQLEIPVETVTEAARLTSGTFVLNPAPAQALPAELLRQVDVLVVNETEYEAVLGTPLPEDYDQVAAQMAAADLTCTLVVTLGGRGAIVLTGDQLTHVTAPPVPVVDTTGAGDTFTGALADALSRGEAHLDAARWAVHAASLSVSALGATTGMPSRPDVLAVLGRAEATDDRTTSPQAPVPVEEA